MNPVPSSRPPLERMLRIHQALSARRFPNALTLAREIEVASKTIHRDLEFMRDRLNLPLAYDHTRKGFHYTSEVSAFPTMQITEGEIFALVVAEKALQQYRGTSFEKPLLSAIRKMEQALPDTISLNLADIEQTVEQIRAAGLDVVLERSGDFAGLGSAQQIAGYRIVQEALTNALRHGDTSRPATVGLAEVGTDAGGPGIHITVRNTMKTQVQEPSATGSVPRIGHGLPGMRERAALAGGTLSAGTTGGEFLVSAFLPAGARGAGA